MSTSNKAHWPLLMYSGYSFKENPEGFVQNPLRISTVKDHSSRISFHFSYNTVQRRDRHENTEHLPATIRLKRMFTSYNFGAAHDQEVLHTIYNAELAALVMEIPHRVLSGDRQNLSTKPVSPQGFAFSH